MLYIYTQNSLFWGSEKERFLERFWIGFWKGFGRGFGEVFGEVLERFLEIILISLSYYFAYHVGKDLVRDLEGIWTDFGMIGMTCHSFLHVFGGHAVMILLLLYSMPILFPGRMRSLCQDIATSLPYTSLTQYNFTH